MLKNYFDYTHKGKSTVNGILEDIYSFKCLFKITYIVEVENHEYNIFIIKFYQKNHRDSKDRYSLLNTKKFLRQHKTSGAKNFLFILNTILQINIDIYKKNKKASFGFMGAPTRIELDPDKTDKIINDDGTVKDTKRFNTYSIYVKRYFSPNNFEHIEMKSSSCYLIKSKSNDELTTVKIESFFEDYIYNYC